MNKKEKILLASTCGLGAVAVTFIALFTWKALSNNDTPVTPGGDEVFTVSWDLDNGEEPIKELYKKGDIPSFKGEVPLRNHHMVDKVEYSGVFTSWDKDLVAVTGDTTYKAQYDDLSVTTEVTFEILDASIGLDAEFSYAGELDRVDWGDGTTVDEHNTKHTFASADTYHAYIYGNISGISFDGVNGGVDYFITKAKLSNTIHHVPDFNTSFQGIHNLKEVELPKYYEEIDDSCFKNCIALEKINIPETLVKIGKEGLRGTKISTFDFSHITVVDEAAFYNSGLAGTLTIPAHFKTLGKSAFEYCSNITKVVFEDNLLITEIPEACFASIQNLVDVDFGNNNKITKINKAAFQGTKISDVVIPEGVKEISLDAFVNDDAVGNLNVKLPSTIQSLYRSCLKCAHGPLTVDMRELSTAPNIESGYDPFVADAYSNLVIGLNDQTSIDTYKTKWNISSYTSNNCYRIMKNVTLVAPEGYSIDIDTVYAAAPSDHEDFEFHIIPPTGGVYPSEDQVTCTMGGEPYGMFLYAEEGEPCDIHIDDGEGPLTGDFVITIDLN